MLREFEVDLMAEIASRLDLRPVWVETRRSEVADALVGGLCDAAASTLATRRDGRGELGRIAATAYLAVPVSLLVRRGERALAVTGLCGARVGV
ncbi:MAG TPA: transporter substrate-binding domain-containing protein, partial [Gaiellaceae bacterium]|nr:transporter substrate-binding domain-containing protein [Gaiellaceae bacterium]